MSLVAQVRNAINQAFQITSAFQSSVTFTHYTYAATSDSYTGKKARTETTQTVSALVDKISKEKTVNGNYVERTTLYINESALALDIQPDDVATFDGQTWIVEPRPDNTSEMARTLPAFVREIPVRRP